MKRLLSLILAMTLVFSVTGMLSGFAAARQISVMVLDEPTELTADPIEIDGTVLVPLRSLCEALECTVEWDFRTETAYVRQGENTLELREGEANAVFNSEASPMPAPVQKIDGLLYVPVRYLAETLGFAVTWNEAARTVEIGAPGSDLPADIGNIYRVVGVTASEHDGNVPENVLDRNYATRWSAESQGANITLELEEVKPVAYIGIACYSGNARTTIVSVQISNDGVSFQEVVTRFVTSQTLNMEPINLGGVYDAKYVRVLGYGNSTNEWNSITELSVYGPYEDGSMPVATDGPDALGTSMDEVPQEVQDVLADYDERFFRRLPILYANLYDREEHGFYMAMSGKDDPEQHTALEMSCWVMRNLHDSFDGWDDMPQEVYDQWVDYYLDRQDPSTGLFIDKQGPVNDRETSRNQTAAIEILSRMGVTEYRYVHPSQLPSGTTSTDTAMRPDYTRSIGDYMTWLQSLPWDNDSWTAGDQMQTSLKNLKYYMDSETYDECIKQLVAWLENRQFENGFWAEQVNFNSLSGAMKVGFALNELGYRYPNPDAILKSVAECFDTDVPSASMHMANPTTILGFIRNYSMDYAQKVQKLVLDKMDRWIAWTDIFATPDGGFSIYHHKSQSDFGGIYGSHQLWEADVDSCHMFLAVRSSLYSMLGMRAPKLKLPDDFWYWITGEKETPSPYIDPIYENVNGTGESAEAHKLDFEEWDVGYKLAGNEYGGSSSSLVSAEIVRDRDRRDNKVLAIHYDGDAGSVPSTTFKLKAEDDIEAVRYFPSKNQTQVVEYDLRVENSGTSNNFYIRHGSTGGYYLNFAGTSPKIGVRISDNDASHGGTIQTLRPKEWYRIRVEAHFGETPEDYFTKIFVDGELIASNNFNFGFPTVAPATVSDQVSVTWYLKGTGTMYLDNILSYNKRQ